MTTTRTDTTPATETALPTGLAELALADLLKKKQKALEVAPGTYRVEAEMRVKVTAEVKRLEDTKYTPTADIPLIPTMAILLARAGITRETSRKLITEAVRDAVAAGGKVGDELAERVEDLEAAINACKKQLSEDLPKKTRKGATKITGAVEVQATETVRLEGVRAM